MLTYKLRYGIVLILALLSLSIDTHAQNNSPVTNSPSINQSFNGMEYIVLAKNNTNRQVSKPILFQSDFPKSNAVYVLRYDYALGEDIEMPEGCVLQFEGGSISGKHKITGSYTSINAFLVKIFDADVLISGTWNLHVAYPEWFGAKGDGINDDADAIQKAFELHCPVYLQSKIYGVGRAINLVDASTITSCVSELNVNPGSLSFSTPNYSPQQGCIKVLTKLAGVLVVNGSGVTIRNIAINGNNKLADCGIGQDRERYKSRVIIDNCYIYDCQKGISTALYLSEIANNTCHKCDIGFQNESGTGATMTSLSITRNYAKNCLVGYDFSGLIYSNMLNNACDKCEKGVILNRVRCCNFLSNGFENVEKLYVLTDYCDAIEFNGVYGVMKDGSVGFFTDQTFYGDFTVKNFKLLHLAKIESLIHISGNTEPTKHCIVHIDRTVNKFLCKGEGKYSIVEMEKNLIDSIHMIPYSENTEELIASDVKRSSKKQVFEIGNGAYFIDEFATSKKNDTKLIYELCDITLEPGEYNYGGFVISDNDIKEGINCVISEGRFTNKTISSTRHSSGCFSIDKKTTIYMNLYIRKIASVPNLIIAPYIVKVN